MSERENLTDHYVYPDGVVRPSDLEKAYDELKRQNKKLKDVNQIQSDMIQEVKEQKLFKDYYILRNKYRAAISYIAAIRKSADLQIKELMKDETTG